MIDKLDITDDVKDLLLSVLILSNKKEVIKKANYFDKNKGEFGNTCGDFQNFIYEKLGLCLNNNNLLNQKNKEDLEQKRKDFESKKVNKSNTGDK